MARCAPIMASLSYQEVDPGFLEARYLSSFGQKLGRRVSIIGYRFFPFDRAVISMTRPDWNAFMDTLLSRLNATMLKPRTESVARRDV